MSELVPDFDWAATPLGSADKWRESLRTTVRILMASRVPMWMAWGPELTVLYNDAYARTTLGKKHPWALGKPASEVWSEIWKDIGPRIERVMETGDALWDETLLLILERSGYPQETYHTFSYSPLAGEDGRTQGVLCVVMEDTGRVLGERQLASLGTLAATLVNANTKAEVLAAISRSLDQKDMPFALTYLVEEDRTRLRLAARSGIDPDHPAACPEMIIGGVPCPWPVEGVLKTGNAVTIDDLAELFPKLPSGKWDRPPSYVRMIPFARRGQESQAGVFIAALNPYRRFDASYAGFLDLIAGQIAAAIANAETQFKLASLRKQAMDQEAALIEEIHRTRQFAWETLEHLPDAFCAFDHDFRVTYLNPAAAKLSSSSNGPKVGEILFDAYPLLIGTSVEANLRRCRSDRVPMDFEQYFASGEGEFWYHFQVYPQPHDRIVAYVRNTTADRRTEQALRRAEQLAAAGRLAASIAHEINNPLEAVTNLLFLAKLDDTIGGNTRNLLEVADRELQRLSHITARSLKFYRQRTASSPTSIEDLMESVLFFHETELKMRGIDLDRRYHPAPLVVCLAGEIQQVLTNLISNAIEATEEQGRMVVGVRPGIDRFGREQVIITVADNGAGMSQFTRDRLFLPFVTTKGEEGTGLGLWVSKGILDKHHASVRVRSRLGLGTVFLIFLPVNPAPEPVLPTHSESG
jgi:signal transduction histidine kinase